MTLQFSIIDLSGFFDSATPRVRVIPLVSCCYRPILNRINQNAESCYQNEREIGFGARPRKLAEAHFFLMKMIERERQLTGEPFTSYRNAFVTAAMAARDPFHTKADKAIKEWREKWEKSLTPEQESIWDAMRHARNDEAHIGRKSRPAKSRRPAEKAGFKLSVDQEEINVGIGSPYYSNRSVRGGGYMSPAILLARGINTNVFAYRDTHSYEIDGQKRNVTAFCGEYLALLQCMVTQYEADHP